MAVLKLEVILGAVDKMTAPIRNALDSAHALNMGIAALGVGLGYSIKQAIDFESQMADVKKVVDFKGAQEFKEMGDAILKMSTEIPITAQGLTEIMAAAGSAGIAKSELLEVTRAAATMGVAFDMAAKDAGDALTSLRANFGLTQKQVINLGDSINWLDNNMSAKSADIVTVLNRIGSVSKIVGFTAEQTAALAATFLHLKSPPEVAGTAIKALMSTLATATHGTKGFRESLEAMGLSAEGVEKSIKNNAQAGMIAFLETINKQKNVTGALIDIFGKEHFSEIAKVAGNLDVYRQAIQLATGDTARFGSMQKEFEIRSGTTANSIELMKNKLTDLSIKVGTIALPYFNKIVSVLSDWVSKITLLTEKHPDLTAGILGTVTALIGLKAVSIGGGFFVGIIKDINAVSAAIYGTLIRSITAMWTALMFNPMSGVIIIISAAVIGLAAIIYKNWQPIKAFISGLFEGLAPLKQVLASISSSPIWQWLVSGISSAINWFRQLFLPIQYTKGELNNAANAGRNMGAAIASGVLKAISALSSVIEYIANLHGRFVNYGFNMMTGLADGIAAGKAAALARISAVADSIKSKFTGILGIHSPSRVFAEYGVNINHGLAAGLQKQQAPLEQINLLARAVGLRDFDISTPIPAYSSPASNSSHSNTSNQTVNINVYASEGMNIDDLVAKIERKFKQKSRAQLFDGAY
jgi:TP901 family phage tail tape measure protein